jgi:hypothetical protein
VVLRSALDLGVLVFVLHGNPETYCEWKKAAINQLHWEGILGVGCF